MSTDETDPFEEARLEELAAIPIADMSDEELGTLEAECLSVGGHRGGRLRAALFELRRHRLDLQRLREMERGIQALVRHWQALGRDNGGMTHAYAAERVCDAIAQPTGGPDAG